MNVIWMVFIDGGGPRPDGSGSRYAFVNATTGEQMVEYVDGLTCNAAEYRALIFALLNLPPQCCAVVYSDSKLVVEQYNGNWAVKNAGLIRLLAQAREVVAARQLNIQIRWIPRKKNLAGHLLESGI